MPYSFTVNGRVDSCNKQNPIKKSFLWLPQVDQLYEVEVYLLYLTIHSNRLKEIIDKCEGNMPPFYPTDPETGLTYCLYSRNPLQVGNLITMQFLYEHRKFSYIGADMLL